MSYVIQRKYLERIRFTTESGEVITIRLKSSHHTDSVEVSCDAPKSVIIERLEPDEFDVRKNQEEYDRRRRERRLKNFKNKSVKINSEQFSFNDQRKLKNGES